MQPSFSATRFVIETRSPIVLTAFAPQFDSLVYEALRQVTGLDHDGIIEKMKTLIQFNESLGVFHASAMRFGITPTQGLIPKTYIRVDSHRGKFSSRYFSPNGKPDKQGNAKYAGVMTAGGPYKPRLTERLAYECPFVCFDTVCDVAPVTTLLSNAFIGIGYDAFRAGQGEIKRITSIPLTENCSLYVNNEARRTIPATDKSITGEPSMSPLLPPYYSQQVEPCVSAPRVAVIAKQQLNDIV